MEEDNAAGDESADDGDTCVASGDGGSGDDVDDAAADADSLFPLMRMVS